MGIVIKAEGLSKAYQLGEFSTGTLTRDIERVWYKLRGKEDPFLKIGEANDRTAKGGSNVVWSLQDINFEIRQGEAVGIVGRNGAGKSTLLKVLSRVTTPTKGVVKIKGRIASLLEVGTGFHPELTGRENIFLNGAILGMRKQEIKRKFDEIVAFAGVERYIDTPVKRYSSGMYVRLAFAVAAHLEPEILIVDEVLAVGDAEFQKKCLGKMKDVSVNDGRTVLFVSHNMEAVQSLCSHALIMHNGQISFDGPVREGIQHYMSRFIVSRLTADFRQGGAPGNNDASLLYASVKSSNAQEPHLFFTNTGFQFDFLIDNLMENEAQLDVTYHLVDERGILIKVGSTAFGYPSTHYKKGILKVSTDFPANILNEGTYTIDRLLLVKNRGTIVCEWKDVLTFEILPASDASFGWQGGKEGVLKIKNLNWKIETSGHD